MKNKIVLGALTATAALTLIPAEASATTTTASVHGLPMTMDHYGRVTLGSQDAAALSSIGVTDDDMSLGSNNCINYKCSSN